MTAPQDLGPRAARARTPGLHRVVRFGIVGVLNTGIDFAVFSTLVFAFGWHVVPANTASYSVAVVNSYLMNKYWTFGDRSTGREAVARGVRFVAFNLVGLAIGNLAVWALARQVPVLAAKVGATALTFVWNYWTNRRFVYRAGP
jgi:putative flippase GtrA